jgi:hypothetical protein
MPHKLTNPTSNDIILSSSYVNIMHSVNLAKWTLGQVFFFVGFWSTQPCQDPMVFESVKSTCVHMVANMSNENIIFKMRYFLLLCLVNVVLPKVLFSKL